MAAPATERSDSARLWPVRATAVITLCAAGLLLPVELYTTWGGPLPPQLACFVVGVAAALAALLSTYTAPGRRHPDGIAFALQVVLAGAVVAYVWLAPASAPIMAGILSSLLAGSTVIAGWSVERTLATGLVLAAVVSAAGATHLAAGAPPAPLLFALISVLIGAAVAVACAAGLERMKATLARRQRELTDLSARLMALHEDERQRLSRELHDGLGQSLTAVLSYLWLVERQVPESTPELRSRVAEARRLASTTMAQIRELSQRLRPSVLDDYGLIPSLEAQVKSFGDRQAIVTTFSAGALPTRLSSEIETAVFRITQEALGNVARHAQATHVDVRLGVDGDELRLEVHDDGIGVDAARTNGSAGAGMGLIGIRERVRALGGRLSLRSAGGAHLEVRLPLPHDTALSPT